MRREWKTQANLVWSRGWSLTTEAVVKNDEGVDVNALLDPIEKEMKQAPESKQWAMNHRRAEIGIHHVKFRKRAIGIGKKLKVLIDYPASPGWTSPYTPAWIAEMVRRKESTPAASKRATKASPCKVTPMIHKRDAPNVQKSSAKDAR